jgi:hypothetical protein
VCSEPSVIACEPRSLNDLPDEILLEILSYFGLEDLCLIIAKVCEKWNVLAKDIILWKKLPYSCDSTSDISVIEKVRCTTLLGFRSNWLTNFAPSSFLKVLNLEEHFRNWTSFRPEARQVSRGVHCVMQSDCYF